MTLEYRATFGHQVKTVRIASYFGGNGGYDILVDNYFQGTVFFRDGTWVGFPSKESVLQGDDIGVLGEVIEEWAT